MSTSTTSHGTITVQLRNSRGKGAARQLRVRGLIPGVLYGRGGDAIALAVDPRLLQRALDPARHRNTLLQVTITGDGPDRIEPCMITELQTDPVTDAPLHVDLLRIDPEREVHRNVPVTYVGKAVGVTAGGRLKTFHRVVPVACKPGEIPTKLELDVTPLELNSYIRVADVKLGTARIMLPPHEPLASVEIAKIEKEEGPAEGAPAAAAAAPAAGSAAAAPAAAGGKPAAGAAPAGKGGKDKKG